MEKNFISTLEIPFWAKILIIILVVIFVYFIYNYFNIITIHETINKVKRKKKN